MKTVTMRMAHITILLAAGIIPLPSVNAQTVVRYDPEKGIVIMDNNVTVQKKEKGKQPLTADAPLNLSTASPEASGLQLKVLRESSFLQNGRKALPFNRSFAVGFECFKNGDYTNSLRNFTCADSIDPKLFYKLWIGKTWRALHEEAKMFAILNEIVSKHPECDVADDALFEMADYYQDSFDYNIALDIYAKIAEQYPFGISAATGKSYGDLIRDQRNLMRTELSTMLAAIGHTSSDASMNYRSFQEEQNLAKTGLPTKETVMLIKTLYRKHLDEEQKELQRIERNRQLSETYLTWTVAAGAIGAINFIVTLVFLACLQNRKQRVAKLHRSIQELKAEQI